MKRNRCSTNLICSLFVFSFMVVVLIPVSFAAEDDCYKHIIFKNEGGFVANGKVDYDFNGYPFSKETGNFNRGQERRLSVPCSATSVRPSYKVAVDNQLHWNPSYIIFKAEDRCFLLKGSTGNQQWQSCDPPGTPPLWDNKCWKHFTFRNEGAYVAKASLCYTYKSAHAQVLNCVDTGQFSHGMVRRLEVPCSYSDEGGGVRVTGARKDFLDFGKMEQNHDYCFVLKGTHPSPRYELCAAEGEQTHRIAIRNYGAYATELSVAYDYSGKRMNPMDVIHTQKRGEISIPAQATNVHIKAKAIGGKTILSTTIPTAKSICWEVRGTTLNPRSAYCPQ